MLLVGVLAQPNLVIIHSWTYMACYYFFVILPVFTMVLYLLSFRVGIRKRVQDRLGLKTYQEWLVCLFITGLIVIIGSVITNALYG
jgi:hypothetical protein